MKTYKVTIAIEYVETLINPRFELVIKADSEADARKKALDIYPTLTSKDLKFDGLKLPYIDISYVDVKGVAND